MMGEFARKTRITTTGKWKTLILLFQIISITSLVYEEKIVFKCKKRELLKNFHTSSLNVNPFYSKKFEKLLTLINVLDFDLNLKITGILMCIHKLR